MPERVFRIESFGHANSLERGITCEEDKSATIAARTHYNCDGQLNGIIRPQPLPECQPHGFINDPLIQIHDLVFAVAEMQQKHAVGLVISKLGNRPLMKSSTQSRYDFNGCQLRDDHRIFDDFAPKPIASLFPDVTFDQGACVGVPNLHRIPRSPMIVSATDSPMHGIGCHSSSGVASRPSRNRF